MPSFNTFISFQTFALKTLKYLLETRPPADLFPNKSDAIPEAWQEEHTKICLHLYLSLLPLNHKLIHDLASVYVGTVADFKRTILRVLEAPVSVSTFQVLSYLGFTD